MTTKTRTMTSSSHRRVVVVSHQRKVFESIPDSVVCRGRQACVDLLEESSRWLWVALSSSLLMAAIEKWLPQRRGESRLGDLLLLETPPHAHVPILRSLFDRVTGEEAAYRLLPLEEMIDVLSAPVDDARDLFIGGALDEEVGALVLVRGDLARLVVPLSAFKSTGEAKPDPRKLEFTDFGQTVKLGQYEAASNAILYEWDQEYRRRLKARQRAEEKGFGPSLRRLRKQLGLKRSDFEGVATKTIARIERGDTEPRDKTRKLIEKRLGLSSEQIETY